MIKIKHDPKNKDQKIKNKHSKTIQIIEISPEEYDILKSACHFKNLKCIECGKLITRKNFGLLIHGLQTCRSSLCMFMGHMKLRDEDKNNM